MKIQEILNELKFFGSQCTKDCSGHVAGWNWALQHKSTTPSMTPSQSFNNGTGIAIDQTNNKRKPSMSGAVRDQKGRYTKFNPQPRRKT